MSLGALGTVGGALAGSTGAAAWSTPPPSLLGAAGTNTASRNLCRSRSSISVALPNRGVDAADAETSSPPLVVPPRLRLLLPMALSSSSSLSSLLSMPAPPLPPPLLDSLASEPPSAPPATRRRRARCSRASRVRSDGRLEAHMEISSTISMYGSCPDRPSSSRTSSRLRRRSSIVRYLDQTIGLCYRWMCSVA